MFIKKDQKSSNNDGDNEIQKEQNRIDEFISFNQELICGIYGEIYIYREDLNSLLPGNWVTDNIIYMFLQYCLDQHIIEGTLISPTFFFRFIKF
jgi:Ulp1 family protease